MRSTPIAPTVLAGVLTAGIAFASMSAALAAPAPQDALGDGRGLEHGSGAGRALDRNTRYGSGGSNAPGVQEDLRARNLVVTGNVAGGRGFRGSVGYTAERDFRGSTSDDTSYDFRAGSAFSDPRVARAGSMGDRLEVSRNYGTIEYGRSAVRGSLSGFDVNGTRLMFDQTAARLLTPEARRSMMDLSTASEVTNASGQKIRLQTGGFRGIAATIDTDAVDGRELGLYDTARLKQDVRDGQLDKELRALEYQNPLMPPREGDATDGSTTPGGTGAGDPRVQPSRIDTGIRSMDSILGEVDRRIERRAERDAAAATTEPGAAPIPGATGTESSLTPAQRARERIIEDLNELRRELRRGLPERDEPEDGRPGSLRSRPGAGATAGGAEGNAGAGGAAGAAGADDAGAEVDPLTGRARVEKSRRELDELIELLRHGKSIDTVSENSVARVREILESAESAMSRQAYFLAEQHFTTALLLMPTNPLAKAGLVNAQLGAGLLASAAISLRELYISNPELIDARLSVTLLPPTERMRALLEKLQQTTVDERNAGDVGLLSAYLGRQLDDRGAIEQGLATLERGSASDRTLALLLRGIWLGAPATDHGARNAPAAPTAPASPPAVDPDALK